MERDLNLIRPCQMGSLRLSGEPCAIARPTEGTERIKSSTVGFGGVVEARMRGRSHGITLRAAGTGKPGEGFGGSSQSAHSSVEAGNDRGAKGCRKVKP
jgi:hypothetical protein